jgi:hypothetical protein
MVAMVVVVWMAVVAVVVVVVVVTAADAEDEAAEEVAGTAPMLTGRVGASETEALWGQAVSNSPGRPDVL